MLSRQKDLKLQNKVLSVQKLDSIQNNNNNRKTPFKLSILEWRCLCKSVSFSFSLALSSSIIDSRYVIFSLLFSVELNF